MIAPISYVCSRWNDLGRAVQNKLLRLAYPMKHGHMRFYAKCYPEAEIVYATQGDHVLGWSAVFDDKKRLPYLNVYVRTEARGHGLGRNLVRIATVTSPHKRLLVSTHNSDTRQWYFDLKNKGVIKGLDYHGYWTHTIKNR